MDRNAASIDHKDSSLRVHQGWWIQRCRGLLVAVFVTDAGLRVLERCWLEYLAGKWKCLFDRETGFIV